MTGVHLRDRWRWAMMACLLLSLIFKIQEYGKPDEETLRALRDQGTERDPLYATKVPLDPGCSTAGSLRHPPRDATFGRDGHPGYPALPR